ncbi:14867_t:CDS:2, partial [Entrophospora sp. SA101]
LNLEPLQDDENVFELSPKPDPVAPLNESVGLTTFPKSEQVWEKVQKHFHHLAKAQGLTLDEREKDVF